MIDRLPLNIGFARVSQATEDQGNLETQARQLQEYGVHEVVTEVGSGARSDRQALRNLKDRLQAGDTLVVTAIDRISRRAVTDAGIHLVVLSQREFDTPPTGQLLLHLTLAIAEWEWSNIRNRSIQGQQRARAEGKRIGRPPVLTPEARQEVERKLLEGQSVTRIAQVHRVHHSVVGGSPRNWMMSMPESQSTPAAYRRDLFLASPVIGQLRNRPWGLGRNSTWGTVPSKLPPSTPCGTGLTGSTATSARWRNWTVWWERPTSGTAGTSLMEVLGGGMTGNRGSRMHPFHALQQRQTWPANGHYLTCRRLSLRRRDPQEFIIGLIHAGSDYIEDAEQLAAIRG